MIKRLLRRGRGIGRAVMIEHSLFSLPFALVALLSESAGRPPWSTVGWIILAVVAARNGANALNRLVDEKIDAENPRTADRPLQTGRVRRLELILFTLFCGLLLLVSAWMLNPLCLALVPAAAVMIMGYSYTKRFTWLCHYWLGITCSAAVMGTFLALTGSFQWRFFPLTGAVMFWVAGFDIIYALQDIDHDRSHGLRSIPARFGRFPALGFAAASFTVFLAGTVLHGLLYGFNAWYYVGVAVSGGILCWELLIAWKSEKSPENRIPFAAYKLNQTLSPIFLLFALAAVYLPGGLHG
ncbi:4-hydroxybenzoate octaprenyltransferase [Marispirochaeta aestuarii]|uniref:4-hydroxybenzoate octaprenyltransferase n=1 Tax=Marispirochaeta aestuarii TaxID=1963862 RepID=UPI0029C8E3D4|nr:4-hydroxybenzoate octaprenyltransferase [Marispirochaeta aestuarii]